MHVLLCIRNGQSKKHFYLLVQSHSLRSLISAHPFPAAALISLAEIWKKKKNKYITSNCEFYLRKLPCKNKSNCLKQHSELSFYYIMILKNLCFFNRNKENVKTCVVYRLMFIVKQLDYFL